MNIAREDITAARTPSPRFSTADFDCELPDEVRTELAERERRRHPARIKERQAPARGVPSWLRGLLIFAGIVCVPLAAIAIVYGLLAVLTGIPPFPLSSQPNAATSTPVVPPAVQAPANQSPAVQTPAPRVQLSPWTEVRRAEPVPIAEPIQPPAAVEHVIEQPILPPRAQLLKLPTPRAAVDRLPAPRTDIFAITPDHIDEAHDITMPYGTVVSATLRGFLEQENQLPRVGHIGDMYVVGSVPWIWIQVPGTAAPTWVDP